MFLNIIIYLSGFSGEVIISPDGDREPIFDIRGFEGNGDDTEWAQIHTGERDGQVGLECDWQNLTVEIVPSISVR